MLLQYVRLQGKTFGEKWCEKLAREYFNLDPRKGSGHDHCKLNKTIEQKSSRYGSNGADWKWQHIEMKHHFDYLLLTGLDFNGFNFYITKRSLVEELINKNIITGQGKKRRQMESHNLNKLTGLKEKTSKKKAMTLLTTLHYLLMNNL